jgi:transcriptional regulator with XRE-family HTH domain
MDIATARKTLNLTQEEMAEKLGVNQTTISRFERGELPLNRRTELAVEALLSSQSAARAA